MANSRDRRPLRRQLQEAGLGALLKPTPPLPPPKSIPLWKKIPLSAYLILVALALAITLLEGYPWLSIQQDASLNPTDPFATMFSVSNGGYVPLTDLDAECTFAFKVESPTVKDMDTENNKWRISHFSTWLWHDGRRTIPCFDAVPRMFQGLSAPVYSRATLKVTITYAFMRINIKRLRKSQTFYFRAVTAADNSQHWQFVE